LIVTQDRMTGVAAPHIRGRMTVLRARLSALPAEARGAALIFATLWAYVFFGDAPDGWTAAGAAVIVGSGVYVWRRERMRTRA